VERNRSIPRAEVVPVLIYPDVRAAVAWLEDALGFSERVQIGEDHRAQLAFGSAGLIVADVRGDQVAPDGPGVPQLVMLRVADVDAVVARARDRGARVVSEPTSFEYGERQSTIVDPFGHRWTLSQTERDVAPEDWGGITVHGGHD
jgi:uncharacterized glyoxalase superfamily protein PhnB